MPSKAAKQLEKIKSEKKLLLTLVFAMVALFLWVVVSLISTRGQQVISPELSKLAEPLVPTLDQNVLEKLENKSYIEPDQLESFPIYALVETSGGEYQLVDVVSQSVQDFELQQEEQQEEAAEVIQQEQPQPESDEGGLQTELDEQGEAEEAELQGEDPQIIQLLE